MIETYHRREIEDALTTEGAQFNVAVGCAVEVLIHDVQRKTLEAVARWCAQKTGQDEDTMVAECFAALLPPK